MTVMWVTHWERREHADRAMLGSAALDVCKAVKSADDIHDSRFYWAGPDTVVLQMTCDTSQWTTQPPNADAARALFSLADLAVRTRAEQWIDPRTGLDQYHAAGR
jgi:hypothetical protein